MKECGPALCPLCLTAPLSAGLPYCVGCLLKPARGGERQGSEPISTNGETIGRYIIQEHLGSGGFADVYSAQATDGGARVAVKLLRPGMDSQEVLARFTMEQRLLRHLRHEGIVRIMDSGLTQLGRPYFVMEQVDGLPITEYCRTANLDLRERLEVFAAACDAVQHAHQKAVIHRDLKPGNILVKETPSGPQPKIIDFGIAKALESQGSGLTMATRLGQIMGTPSYISPEQAAGSDNADTRSDIYSLGAVLYEVVTGRPPWSPEELQRVPPAGLHSFLLERVPDPPSERARLAGAAAGYTRQLAGDVDHIVMMALCPAPERRYASAAALAEDVRRWLSGQPVTARPPSFLYQLSRITRRYRWQSAAALAAVAGIAGTVVLSLLMARRARSDAAVIARERDRADFSRERAAHQNYQSAIRLARLHLESGQFHLASQCLIGTDPALRAWEWNCLAAALPKPLAAMDSGLSDATMVAACPSGRFAVLAAGRQLMAVDLSRLVPLFRSGQPERIERLAVSEDALTAVICRDADPAAGTLTVLNEAGSTLWSLPLEAGSDAAWEPDGTLLCVEGDGTHAAPGHIRRREAQTGRIQRERAYPRARVRGGGLIVGPRGLFAAVRRTPTTFDLLDLNTLTIAETIIHDLNSFAQDALPDEKDAHLLFAQRSLLWKSGAPGAKAEAVAILALPKRGTESGKELPEEPIRRLNWLNDGRWAVFGESMMRAEGEFARRHPNTAGLHSVSLAGGLRLSLYSGGRLEIHEEVPPPLSRELPSRRVDTGNGGRRVVMSPNSSLLAMQTRVRTAVCFVPLNETGTLVRHRTPGRSRLAWSLLPEFCPDGSLLCAGAEHLESLVFSGQATEAVPLSLPAGVWSATTTRDGSRLAAGTEEGVIVLDWKSRMELWRHRLPCGPFHVFAGPDRDTIFALGSDGALHRCSLASSHTTRLVGASGPKPPVAAWNVRHQLLAIIEPGGLHVHHVLPDGSLASRQHLPTVARVSALAFDREANRLAVATEGHELTIWDWRHKLPLLDLPVRNMCTSICFSDDGRWLAHTDTNPSAVIYGAAK